MKHVTVLLGCLMVAAVAFSQDKKVSFNDLEKSADSKNITVFSLNGKPFTGTTYDEFEQDQIYREVEIKDGYRQKESGWYSDGTKELDISYRNGLLHGKFMTYHRNGNRYQEENYENGVTEGKQYRYNCDGSLQSEWDTVSGVTLMQIDLEVKKCQANCKKRDGC